MSIELRDQLAEYGRQLDAAQNPVGYDEIVPPGEFVRPIPLVAWGDPKPGRRARWIGATAVAAVVLLVAAIAPLGDRGTDSSRYEIADVIPLGGQVPPAGIVEADGAVWVLTGYPTNPHDPLSSTLLRIDPDTGVITDRVAIDGPMWHPVATPGAIWVLALSQDGVRRIDTESRQITNTIDVPEVGGTIEPDAGRMIVAGGQVWVAHAEGFVRIDPDTLETERFSGPAGVSRVWAGESRGGLWLQDSGLTRIDLTTGAIEQFELGLQTWSRAQPVLGPDAIWLIRPPGRLVRFDLESRQITDTISFLGKLSWGGIYAGDAVWVTTSQGILRVDAATHEVVEITEAAGVADFVAGDDGRLWVSFWDGGVSRIDLATREITPVIEPDPGPGPVYTSLLASNGVVWVARGDTLTRIDTS